MHKDFRKHHEIINDFRGKVSKKDFESKYASATKHLNKKDKFLLKMELKRLSTVCTRAIDLRGVVTGECQFFDYQGQSHYLDEVAIAAFKESAEAYGTYTFGVYEAIINAKNSFRNIYKTEKVSPTVNDQAIKKTGVEKIQYPAKLMQLNVAFNRAEERMNFAIPIKITVATGTNNKEIKTTSIDMSVSGIKFKLFNEVVLSQGDEVNIAFTGLEQEFQFTKGTIFYYEVKNVFRDSGTQIIGCQRIDIPKSDSFERFLSGYIQGYKRRYKINLDNSLVALQSRIYEQYALVKISELPIFMEQSAGEECGISPRYVLTTKNNNALYQYWLDEKNNSALPYLINEERIKRLQLLDGQGKGLLVFSFTHQHKGNKFFYCFDEEQLKEDATFFEQYIAFAAQKESFSIVELKLSEISSKYAYSPYTLSTAMTKQQSYLNPPLTDEVKGILTKLPLLVTITDLTNLSVVSDYQELSYGGIDLDKLKGFGKKPSADKQVDEIVLGFGHQRQEARFKFKTPVNIECDEIRCSGESVDFSISGMKIDLGTPTDLSKGDVIFLSFPKLQKITSSFDLKHLPYKIIRLNKDRTKINLRVSVKEHQHIGRSFFKLLINKNRDKLTPDEYAMLTPGLSGALRTLYAAYMAIPCAVAQSSGSRYKVEVLVAGELSKPSNNGFLSELNQLSDRQGYYNLYPLLGNLQVNNLFDHHMKKLLPSDTAVSEVIYVAINQHVTDVKSRVVIKQEREFTSLKMRTLFIDNALKKGAFYSIKLMLSRRDEAVIAHLNPELAYISAYAIHRGKQLEQEIYSVAGIIQVADVSQEVLFRHHLLKK